MNTAQLVLSGYFKGQVYMPLIEPPFICSKHHYHATQLIATTTACIPDSNGDGPSYPIDS